MKKELIKRCLIGALIGLSISYIITIIISMIINKGEYYPVPSQLIKLCGNEMNAVIIQAIFSLIYGAICFGTSVIWNIDRWSILKQTVIHFLVISLTSLPIAYFMYWMPHNILGIISYFAIFIFIYLIIWLSAYFSIKKNIQEINKNIKV